MWIVAIGWSYVVILMAATETSFVAGVMTFLVYCMIPLSVLFYITGGKRRRARRALLAGKTAPAAPRGATLPVKDDEIVVPNAQFDAAADANEGTGRAN
jgi:amino acid transporter